MSKPRNPFDNGLDVATSADDSGALEPDDTAEITEPSAMPPVAPAETAEEEVLVPPRQAPAYDPLAADLGRIPTRPEGPPSGQPVPPPVSDEPIYPPVAPVAAAPVLAAPAAAAPVAAPPAAPVAAAPVAAAPQQPVDPAMADVPTQVSQPNVAAAPMGPHLLCLSGANRGKLFPLKEDQNGIGRGVDNDVILSDISVSRRHTLVCFEKGQFVVRDLGSGNGTLVNGARLSKQLMTDGDQLELGNTVLRFVDPRAQQEQPEQLAELKTVVTQRPESPSVTATANIGPQAAGDAQLQSLQDMVPADLTTRARPATEPRRVSPADRRRKLLIFGSVAVVLLLGAMGGLKFWLNSKKAAQQAAQQAVPSPDELAAQEYQQGISQFRLRKWDQARAHFQKVLELVPSADYAKQYITQSSTELAAQEALQRAKQNLKIKDFAAARGELTKIASASVYATEVQQLKQKLDDGQLSSLLDTAQKLREAGDQEAALEKVQEALKIAPTNPEVLKLSQQLEGGEAATPSVGKTSAHARPAHSTPAARSRQNHTASATGDNKPIRVRGKQRQVLGLYKQRQWGAAHREAQAQAEALSGRAQRRARALAQAIFQVGTSWGRAERSPDQGQKMTFWQQALASDRRIQGGFHQRELKRRVVSSAKAAAASAITRHNYMTAAQAVKLVEKYGGPDPLLKKVKKALESKAMELFTRGYTLRNSNPTQARRAWQQVLKIAPSGSAARAKASKWLNSGGVSYQGEDEE